MNRYIRPMAGIQSRVFSQSFTPMLDHGCAAYDRRKHLKQLLPIATAQIEDQTPETGKWITLRLAGALRQERKRGRAGHWAYNLNRHLALLQAYRGERKLLESVGS